MFFCLLLSLLYLYCVIWLFALLKYLQYIEAISLFCILFTIWLGAYELLGSDLLQFGINLPRLSACPDIRKGVLFPNFDIAVHFCVEYGRFKGFTVQKKRMEKNSDGSIRSRCLDCEYSGKVPNDNNRITTRNKRTKKTQCQWHINLSQPILASYVRVNTFLDEHNHALLPDTEIFSTEFRALPDEMKN